MIILSFDGYVVLQSCMNIELTNYSDAVSVWAGLALVHPELGSSFIPSPT